MSWPVPGVKLHQYHHALRPILWFDDHTVIAGSFDGMLGRFDVTKEKADDYAGTSRRDPLPRVVADDKLLVVGDEDGLATLWSTDGKRLRTLGGTPMSCAICCSRPTARVCSLLVAILIVRVYSLTSGRMEELGGK